MKTIHPVRKLLNSIGILTDTFTAAVATDLLTQSAHGLKDGDPLILTTADTLPAGLELLTTYYVRDASTNTFRVSLDPNGIPINITDTGTGAHTYTMHDVSIPWLVEDFRNIILALAFNATANLTLKFQGSVQEDAPDFSAAQSPTNKWDYIETISLEDQTAVDGDTGYTVAGAAEDLNLEANVNHLRWFSVQITAWSAGAASIDGKPSDNQ